MAVQALTFLLRSRRYFGARYQNADTFIPGINPVLNLY